MFRPSATANLRTPSPSVTRRASFLPPHLHRRRSPGQFGHLPDNCSPPDGLTKPTPPRTPRDPTHQTLSHHAATYTRTLVGPLLQLRELTKLPACLPACNMQASCVLSVEWNPTPPPPPCVQARVLHRKPACVPASSGRLIGAVLFCNYQRISLVVRRYRVCVSATPRRGTMIPICVTTRSFLLEPARRAKAWLGSPAPISLLPHIRLPGHCRAEPRPSRRATHVINVRLYSNCGNPPKAPLWRPSPLACAWPPTIPRPLPYPNRSPRTNPPATAPRDDVSQETTTSPARRGQRDYFPDAALALPYLTALPVPLATGSERRHGPALSPSSARRAEERREPHLVYT
ncbi:hypothetical protein PCL_09469 [Purpureocillium lilacinum]|uniref:Uncharacterized protein n=1 Tax=Purpureocillium lilacinum TaxID=33203 RepID=A0A2U3DQZ6_PURLI|nr:hypothetical protein PCL_09469 [Purpureocillium lilacinum]